MHVYDILRISNIRIYKQVVENTHQHRIDYWDIWAQFIPVPVGNRADEVGELR